MLVVLKIRGQRAGKMIRATPVGQDIRLVFEIERKRVAATDGRATQAVPDTGVLEAGVRGRFDRPDTFLMITDAREAALNVPDAIHQKSIPPLLLRIRSPCRDELRLRFCNESMEREERFALCTGEMEPRSLTDTDPELAHLLAGHQCDRLIQKFSGFHFTRPCRIEHPPTPDAA